MIDKSRIIPSVVQFEQIKTVLDSSCKRVNLLVGNINNLAEVVHRLHSANKRVFVHIEMIGGIARDKDAVKFLIHTCQADGVIATKTSLILAAKSCGVSCIQRIFAIDTSALKTALKTVQAAQPDEVEVMPGLMPEVIRQFKSSIPYPLIVGGLIKSSEAVSQALQSGADYVSTGHEALW
ncbi:MAG: glycerol-3-phosphate responsive antiterminator [Acetanaerobacterium sp.]